MSQITASSGHGHSHPHDAVHDGGHAGGHGTSDLGRENIYVPDGWGRTFGMTMLAVGVLACIATLASPLMAEADLRDKAWKHALTSYHVGFIVTLGLMLGSLGLILIFNLTKSGWSVTLRRQLENVASTLPWAILLIAPVIALPILLDKPGILLSWMTPGAASQDAILQEKSLFLNPLFFYVRLFVYFVVWLYLGSRMMRLSREQDASGDKWLSNKASFTSAWGILAFAITVAFASFDLIKSMDYHWFSTMFGVYFFAGNMIASLAFLAVLLVVIKASGRLNGLVTEEHLHDLGKLMFGFTVFWAYIAFSQYFLIWYANIPEETAWMIMRKSNGWQYIGLSMIIGHFGVPFLFLLWRANKRGSFAIALAGLVLLAMHCVDIFWVIRPIVYKDFPSDGIIPGKIGFGWMDVTGLIGPLCIFFWVLSRRIAAGPLIPIKDPRLPEALAHKNYV